MSVFDCVWQDIGPLVVKVKNGAHMDWIISPCPHKYRKRLLGVLSWIVLLWWIEEGVFLAGGPNGAVPPVFVCLCVLLHVTYWLSKFAFYQQSESIFGKWGHFGSHTVKSLFER